MIKHSLLVCLLRAWLLRAFLLPVGLLLACMPAQADEFQPLTVRIALSAGNQQSGYLYTVETRIPNDQRIARPPQAELAVFCKKISEQLSRLPDRSYRRSEAYNCRQSLHGSSVKLNYGGRNPGLATLISVELGENHSASVALAAHQSDWQIPAKLSSRAIATQYAGLGFKHLLTGFDHLLFVACLLFICLGRWRQLLITITAFTIAHSLSLGLNAFGLIFLNVRAVEAIIALSIVYLACDIIRHSLRHGRPPSLAKGDFEPSLSYRHPATVAGVFGLLHGLGFANILNEFGLPQGDKLVALFSFNVGIEIGQLVFIGAVLVFGWITTRLIKTLNSGSARRMAAIASSYVIGSVAMFWTIERIMNTL